MQTSAAPDRSGLGVKATHRLYFAYGSNMNPAQVTALCGHPPKVVGIASLPGHRLAFYGHSKTWDSGLETVEPAPGEAVWGALYEISFADAEALDGYQDARLDGAGAYFHYPTVVLGAECKSYPALLYKKDMADERKEPSREYLEHIIQGGAHHGLPGDYLEKLRGIATHPAQYEVPRKPRFGAGLLSSALCSGCGDLRASRGGPGLKPA
jgi:hypothetical protein